MLNLTVGSHIDPGQMAPDSGGRYDDRRNAVRDAARVAIGWRRDAVSGANL